MYTYLLYAKELQMPNSIIEAQREFEEQRLKIRLLELRNLKVQSASRVGKTHLLARALAMSGIKLQAPMPTFAKGGIDVCQAAMLQIRQHYK